MPLIDDVTARIEAKKLLDHPFYTAWSDGTLSREALERYAEQYYHWVRAFPTFLSLTHAHCPHLEVRQEILENLIDEERGPDNHPELWLRFCDALGLDRDAVRDTERYPETGAAIRRFRELCGRAPFTAGLAALYAYESQQPEVMATKRTGLRDRYGVTTGHDYFVEHETADIEHSESEWRLVEAHVNGDAPAVLNAVDGALDGIYTLLDGVYERHVTA